MENKLTRLEKKIIREYTQNRGFFLSINTKDYECYFFNSFDKDENNKFIKKYNPYSGVKEYLWTGEFVKYNVNDEIYQHYDWLYSIKEDKFYSCEKLHQEVIKTNKIIDIINKKTNEK